MGVWILFVFLQHFRCEALKVDPGMRARGHAVVALPDGGAAVVGRQELPGRADRDALVVRFSPSGVPIHWRSLGTSRQEEALAAVALPGGEVMAVGLAEEPRTRGRAWESADVLVFLVGRRGEIQWSVVFGGRGEDAATAIEQVQKDTLWISGHSAYPLDGGRRPGWFVAGMDTDGHLLWARRYALPYGTAWFRVRRLVGKPGGGAWAVGELSPRGKEDADLWVARMEGMGEVTWMIRLGAEGRQVAVDAVPDGKGGVVVLGSTRRFRGTLEQRDDLLLLSLNARGEVQWIRQVGTSGEDHPGALKRAPQGYLAVGWSSGPDTRRGDGWLLGLGVTGEVRWVQQVGGARTDRLLDLDLRGNRWWGTGWTLSYAVSPYSFHPTLWFLTGTLPGRACSGCTSSLIFREKQATFRVVPVTWVAEWHPPAWAVPLLQILPPPIDAWVVWVLKHLYKTGYFHVFSEVRPFSGKVDREKVRGVACSPAFGEGSRKGGG